jgi:hypothetical protein
MHHTHPSAGSVMFGGYPDSNNSSPAPPPSAGNVPPYPYQQGPQHGAVRHGPHQSNGATPRICPMASLPWVHRLLQDTIRVQMASSIRVEMTTLLADKWPPSAPLTRTLVRPATIPSTPQSFHGSQSSAPNEQENGPAFYSQYPTAVVNGSNGHIDEVRLYHSHARRIALHSQQVVTDHEQLPWTSPPPKPTSWITLMASLDMSKLSLLTRPLRITPLSFVTLMIVHLLFAFPATT